MQLVWGAALLVLVGWCRAQVALQSLCPDVFKYHTAGGSRGRWDGIVTIYNGTIYPLWLNIVLDRKAELLGSWNENVTTVDNIDFKIGLKKIKNPSVQATNIGFYVIYNPDRNIPRVVEIKINGREICNVDVPLSVPKRLVFDNGKELLRSPKRKKREYSWMSEITWKGTNPSTHMSNDKSWISFMPPKPPSSQPVFPAPKPNSPVNTQQSNEDDWTRYITGIVPQRPQLVVPVVPAPQTMVPVPQPQLETVDEAKCGTLDKEIASALVVGGHQTVVGQWPWQVALYRNEHVNSEFFCGGTLVSQRHVVTAAYCVTLEASKEPIEMNTLSVYLGKHNLHSTNRGVQIKFVTEIIVHPQYNVTILAQNVAILRLQETVRNTQFVRPACLWPEDRMDLSSVIGKIGTVVGWGIDATNKATEELTQVEMPVVEQETCVRSYSAFFGILTTDTTFCAGYKDGTAPCNGDAGGGMVMKIGGSWYLRGLVSLSVSLENDFCDPSHYVIFTDLAKFVPWIKENIR